MMNYVLELHAGVQGVNALKRILSNNKNLENGRHLEYFLVGPISFLSQLIITGHISMIDASTVIRAVLIFTCVNNVICVYGGHLYHQSNIFHQSAEFKIVCR